MAVAVRKPVVEGAIQGADPVHRMSRPDSILIYSEESIMSIQTTLKPREVVACAVLAVITAGLTTLLFIHVLFDAPIVA